MESPLDKALNQILSITAMLVNCVLGCSHNLNTWKRSWQIKTPRSGVIWKYLLMCAAWQESRINPSLRHRGYFFTVRHWRWQFLQLQKDPSWSRVAVTLVGFSDLAGLLWGLSSSRTFLFHPQSWPSALISDLNLGWKFDIVKMLQSCHTSVIKLATCSHKMGNCWPSLAQQQLGEQLGSQECKSMRGTTGLAYFYVPWSCRMGLASCQQSGTNTLGAKHKSKVLVERRWVISWEEHPQRQPRCKEGVSLRLFKECSN